MGMILFAAVCLLTLAALGITTPTSMVKRITGEETWPDPVAFPTGCTFNGVAPAGVSGNAPVAVAAATTTLTLSPALHAGRVVTVASTGGLAVTPPAATGTGNVYTLVVVTTVSGGSVTVDAKAGNASDVVSGRAYQLKVGTGEVVYAAGATDNLITLDGSTRGGVKGDRLVMIDVATNMWHVFLDTTATGTVATPFSSH